ncbi:NUDIX hydrolase [Levyella massiliensis]|uniref:NUDIX hydrolase n=1 Tax=Levyella massiliensis TaxID=938289 RepID=UPI003999F3D9
MWSDTPHTYTMGKDTATEAIRALPQKKRAEAFRHRAANLIGEQYWRDYAVFMPWVNTPKGPCLILEKRAHHLHAQPGEICFPGGAVENGETFLEAAVRETCEELLVDRTQLEVIGPGEIFITPTQKRLDSFLGILHDFDGRFSTAEVASLLWVPVSDLYALKPEVYEHPLHLEQDPAFPLGDVNRPYTWKTGSYRTLLYRWKGHCIWGITARLLEAALALIRDYELESILVNEGESSENTSIQLY